MVHSASAETTENELVHSASADGHLAFCDIHNYLRCGTYPDSFTKPDKQALRKRSKFFMQKGDKLLVSLQVHWTPTIAKCSNVNRL